MPTEQTQSRDDDKLIRPTTTDDDDRYFIFHVNAQHLRNVELRISGTLVASDLIDSWLWPAQYKPGGDFDFGVLQFDFATNLTICGGGTVDGQGYPWW